MAVQLSVANGVPKPAGMAAASKLAGGWRQLVTGGFVLPAAYQHLNTMPKRALFNVYHQRNNGLLNKHGAWRKAYQATV